MSDFEFTITETSAMVDLEEYLNYLILERCSEISSKIIHQNAEYQNLQGQIESVLKNSCGYFRNRCSMKSSMKDYGVSSVPWRCYCRGLHINKPLKMGLG
jgi:hypothetical protein